MMVSLLDALPWRIGKTVETCLAPTPEDNSILVQKSAVNENLVVVLGWGGALQKHLSRLRQHYDSHGYTSVTYISPMSCFLQGGLIESDITELAQTIVTELSSVQQKRFHVHIHSNNGTMVWGALMLELSTSHAVVFDSLVGIVFDSAPRIDPTPPGLLLMAFGFTFPCIPIILRKNTYVHPIWTPALFVYFLLKLLWLRLKGSAGHRLVSFAQIRNAVLSGMPLKVPQLYVYSKKDMLISSAAVEDFMAKQKKRGIAVSSKVFHDTAHVQHFKLRDVEYKEALKTFLDDARIEAR